MDQQSLRESFRECPVIEVIDALCNLEVSARVVHAAQLSAIADIDAREGYRADGCVSMVDWICFRLSKSRTVAHEWLEAARALDDLPQLSETYAAGELSWEKARAVASVATPESDASLTEEAKTIDVGRLQTAARRARAVSIEEAERRHRARFISMRRSRVTGGVKLSGFLPDIDGETVFKTIERLADNVPKDADTGLYGSFDERCADALVQLASGQLAADQQLHGERAMIVAHVDLAPPEGGTDVPGRAELASEFVLAPESMARLMCDAVIDPHFEINDETVGLGQQTRQPTQRLRRYLTDRDVGCRFPGCTRTRLVQSHHQIHWTTGGPTQPDNLVMLCRTHHRKMHEGKWGLRGSPEGLLDFVKPNGEVLSSELPRLSDEVKRRILGPVLPDGP